MTSVDPGLQAPAKAWSLAGIGFYPWLVLLACYAGGMFDGLDSSLFTAVAKEAVTELSHAVTPEQVSLYGAWITALFLTGWTVGGMVFGMLGDRIGRVKALTASILIYALFTGLCGLAQNIPQLMFFRFMTALGIGGELIVGTTLVAEAWPERHRAKAVGFLTTAYQFGYCLVGAVTLLLSSVLHEFSWRHLFFIGVVPAVLVMFIRRGVSEPERWQALDKARKTEDGPAAGCISDLFAPDQRRNTITAGIFTGVLLIAYWASTFWIPTWVHQLMLPGDGDPVWVKGMMMLLIGGMAVPGCVLTGWLVDRVGRRGTVVLSYVGYLLCSIGLFMTTHHYSPMLFVWGSVLGVFVGMSISACYIYVPELFPTRLRATGTGFCFNSGRMGAALGVLLSSQLVALFGGSYAASATALSLILIPGILAVLAAPETRGQPLRD